jgi:hypothetical protein
MTEGLLSMRFRSTIRSKQKYWPALLPAALSLFATTPRQPSPPKASRYKKSIPFFCSASSSIFYQLNQYKPNQFFFQKLHSPFAFDCSPQLPSSHTCCSTQYYSHLPVRVIGRNNTISHFTPSGPIQLHNGRFTTTRLSHRRAQPVSKIHQS